MANDLIAQIEQSRPSVAALLQGNPALSAERLISLFYGDLRRSRALAQCTPESLIRALLQCAAVGVEANTPLQHACIIPRKGIAQFQIMYRGLMYLGVVHGSVSDWRAEAVYDRDVFAYQPAHPTEPIRHIPFIAKRSQDGAPSGDRGPLIGAYSLVFLPSGMARAKWMPIEEIREIRDKYSESWKAGHTGPWKDREAEMSIKTVVINHSKQIRMAGPPPVTVGEQVWERGPAAVTVTSFDEEWNDGELAPEDKPRAAAAPVAQRKEQPVSTGMAGGSNPSGGARLVLTPDNDPQGGGADAVSDTSSGAEAGTATAEASGDTRITEVEAEALLDGAKALGLTVAQRGQLLERFAVDSYEYLTTAQSAAFVDAMKAVAKGKVR